MITALIARSEHKRLTNILTTRLIRDIRESVGACENCGSTEVLTCHHIKKRCYKGTDYGDNLTVLCNDCHISLHCLEEEKLKQGVAEIIALHKHGCTKEDLYPCEIVDAMPDAEEIIALFPNTKEVRREESERISRLVAHIEIDTNADKSFRGQIIDMASKLGRPNS